MEKEIRKEICELLDKENELKRELKQVIVKEKTIIEKRLIGKCFKKSFGPYDSTDCHLFKEFIEADPEKFINDSRLSFITVSNRMDQDGKIAVESEKLLEVLRWFAKCDMREIPYKEFMLHFSSTEKCLLDDIQQTSKYIKTNTEKQDESK